MPERNPGVLKKTRRKPFIVPYEPVGGVTSVVRDFEKRTTSVVRDFYETYRILGDGLTTARRAVPAEGRLLGVFRHSPGSPFEAKSHPGFGKFGKFEKFEKF